MFLEELLEECKSAGGEPKKILVKSLQESLDILLGDFLLNSLVEYLLDIMVMESILGIYWRNCIDNTVFNNWLS